MKNLYTLKKYFAVYKVKLFWGFIFILLSNAGAVYIPLLLKNGINELQRATPSTTVLMQYALTIAGASLFAGCISFLYTADNYSSIKRNRIRPPV